MRVRLGILGAARIAPRALIQPARDDARAIVAGVAARDPERARAFAAEHEIAEVFADYAALIASPNIDAVYNALPPAMHAQLTIAALDAGKHVLCEKPFALDAHEARAMADAARANDRVLMEALHYRYHPLFVDLVATVASGRIGALVRMDALFVALIAAQPGSIRHDAALGGGALMDLGVYCLHWFRTLARREPVVTSASFDLTEGGIDQRARAELDFGGGLTAGLYCAMDEPHRTALTLIGETGRIDVANPLVPHRPHMVTIQNGAEAETRTYAPRTTFAYQLDAFLDAVTGSGPGPLTGGEDAVRNMAALDACRTMAART